MDPDLSQKRPGGTGEAAYRGLSFWHDSVPDPLSQRAPLPGNRHVDVVILGAGLTGLWTAYYLGKRSPGLRIAVLEKRIAGFGASGRNGGWCSALFPQSTGSLDRTHGRDAAVAMRRAMIGSVDEVGRVVEAEGIDCDYAKGGTRVFARSRPQQARAAAEVAEAGRYGVDQLVLRGPVASVSGCVAEVFDPACASLHPAKLVRGLAHAVERQHTELYEGTRVLDWSPHRVVTDRGTVDAGTIVVAMEGYGATLPQTHRRTLPLYSLMIATEPLSEQVWQELGIGPGQTFSDFRHLLVYGQRTADNRIAFGGRGARYHWGSSIRPEYDRVPRVFEHLRRELTGLFPQLAGVAITHAWGGPLGVPRDWHPSAGLDRATGIAWAGGYVGDGLSTTNLAGRTLADLIGGSSSELTALPWVNHRAPDWEPEPLRFIGANLGLLAMGIADSEERITGRRSVAASIMRPLTGR